MLFRGLIVFGTCVIIVVVNRGTFDGGAAVVLHQLLRNLGISFRLFVIAIHVVN